MAKSIYLYSYISNYSIEPLNKQIDDIDENENITVRINSGGGDVDAGYAFLSRMSEHKGEVNAIVDGYAASMAAFWLPFFNEVTANDTSRLMFHKAAYPEWYTLTEDQQTELDDMNAKFEDKMRKKVEGKPGAKKFLDKLFEKGVRNDVRLTPAEAKRLGIVNKIRKLEPTAYENMQIVAVMEEESLKPNIEQTDKLVTNENDSNMSTITQEQLDAAVEAAYEKGRSEEHDRCSALAEYIDIAPERVKALIEDKDAKITHKIMAEMSKKMLAKDVVENHNQDNLEGVDTPADTKTAEHIKAEEDKKELDNVFKTI